MHLESRRNAIPSSGLKEARNEMIFYFIYVNLTILGEKKTQKTKKTPKPGKGLEE